jgi:hypothetical protein
MYGHSPASIRDIADFAFLCGDRQCPYETGYQKQVYNKFYMHFPDRILSVLCYNYHKICIIRALIYIDTGSERNFSLQFPAVHPSRF